LVEGSGRYEVLAKHRIYRKLAHVGQCCEPVIETTEDANVTKISEIDTDKLETAISTKTIDFKNVVEEKDSKFWRTSKHNTAMEIGIDKGQTTAKLASDFKNVHILDFEYRVQKIKQGIASSNHSGTKARIFPQGSSYRLYDSYTYSLKNMLQQVPRPSLDYVFIDGAHEWHHDGFAFFLVDMMVPVGGLIVFADLPWTIAGSPSVNPKKHPEVLKRLTMKQMEMKHVQEICDVLVDSDPRYKMLHKGLYGIYVKVAETDGCCKT